MRLGVSYCVFEGVELLEPSILQIRKHVDRINVVYQKISYFNTPCKDYLESVLCDLQKRGLVDAVIKYENDFTYKKNRENEVNKRNIGLQDCINHGCDYFLTIDVDEFYRTDEFVKAKQFIIDNNIDTTYCRQVAYKTTTEPAYGTIEKLSWIQFITKINKYSKYFRMRRYYNYFTEFIDETRFFKKREGKVYVFNKTELLMHHMSIIRIDPVGKLKSNQITTPEKIEQYKKFCIKQPSENEFGINFEKFNPQIMPQSEMEKIIIDAKNIKLRHVPFQVPALLDLIVTLKVYILRRLTANKKSFTKRIKKLKTFLS